LSKAANLQNHFTFCRSHQRKLHWSFVPMEFKTLKAFVEIIKTESRATFITISISKGREGTRSVLMQIPSDQLCKSIY
jgi:hypothetical protein